MVEVDEFVPEQLYFDAVKDLSFSSLSSEIGSNWTLTWDKTLPTETVATIGIGVVLESEFFEVPTLLDPPVGVRRTWLDDQLTKHDFILLLFYRGLW